MNMISISNRLDCPFFSWFSTSFHHEIWKYMIFVRKLIFMIELNFVIELILVMQMTSTPFCFVSVSWFQFENTWLSWFREVIFVTNIIYIWVRLGWVYSVSRLSIRRNLKISGLRYRTHSRDKTNFCDRPSLRDRTHFNDEYNLYLDKVLFTLNEFSPRNLEIPDFGERTNFCDRTHFSDEYTLSFD